MNTKRFASAFILIALLVFSSFHLVANAANVQISDVVIEKDSELLSIDLNLYLQMKAADVAEITGNDGKVITPSYIKVSTGRTYRLNDYFNARAASNDGQISSGLQMLESNASNFAQTIQSIELTFQDGKFVRGSGEFSVISID